MYIIYLVKCAPKLRQHTTIAFTKELDRGLLPGRLFKKACTQCTAELHPKRH